MSVQTTDRDKAVAAAIREISHIATLPEITLRIIELVEDPDSTANDLHKIIANDPALCSRILKVVNSAFYGLPGQIGSINRAIVLLGLNAVKNIAIAASLAKLFKGGSLTGTFNARDLWDHSIAVATGCKMVAENLKLGLTDEAFLAGLMHDIGIVVEIQYDRQKLIEVLGRCAPDADGNPGADMLTAETEIFAANHQDFGAALCEKWKFPKTFLAVTGNHHNPMDLPAERRTLPCIVYVADRLAGSIEGGFRMDLQSLDMSPEVLDELKLSRDALQNLCDTYPEALESVENVLT